jgi:hypothetical protein
VYDGTDREVGNGAAAGRQTACTSVSMRSITDDAGMNIIDIIEVPLFASRNVCASEFQFPGFFFLKQFQTTDLSLPLQIVTAPALKN